ncbi:MAG: hypothetical protein RBT40_13130 [Petrimonas sp.]|jgi:hypothetical protein|nr:hypothetical protein [Petrimonas sp.]
MIFNKFKGRFRGHTTASAVFVGYSLCIILMISSIAFIVGCRKGRKENAVDESAAEQSHSRVNDKEYMDSLVGHQDQINAVARQRSELNQKMKRVAEKLKSELSIDVSEEDFKKMLEQNAEWQELLKRTEEISNSASNVLLEARRMIRERILREERDNSADQM